MPFKHDLYFDGKPPEKTGTYKVQKFDTSGSAASADWAGGLSTSVPYGPCWVELTALTKDVWVRFGNASTTATDATNGAYIPTGGTKKFFVDPVKHRYIDHLGSGTGTMLVQVVSQPSQRNDQ